MKRRMITSHDRGVLSHDRGVISHDRGVISHDRGVISHDRGVISHDRGVISHDRGVISHDRGVISHVIFSTPFCLLHHFACVLFGFQFTYLKRFYRELNCTNYSLKDQRVHVTC